MKKSVLFIDVKEFTSKNNEVVNYYEYYILVNGIKIKLKCDNEIGKELIKQAYESLEEVK